MESIHGKHTFFHIPQRVKQVKVPKLQTLPGHPTKEIPITGMTHPLPAKLSHRLMLIQATQEASETGKKMIKSIANKACGIFKTANKLH